MYLIIGDNMKMWKDRKKYYIDGDIEPSKKKKYFFTKSLKRQTLVMIFSVLVVFLAMSGTSYAIFSSINQSEDYNGVKVGNLQITYKDESGAVSLANAFPMSDEDGLKSQAYSFSIQNTGSLATSYSVKLLDDQAVIDGEEKSDSEMVDKLLDKNNIKVSVNGDVPIILGDLSINNYEVLKGNLQPGETKKVEVRIWIKSDASNDIFYKNSDGSLSGKYYFGKITVEGENTKTYETDNMLLWLDAKNNDINGHSSTAEQWYDLSGNANYSLASFSNYTWNNNSLNIASSDASSIVTTYDVSSLSTYSISTSFKLTSNTGLVDIINTNDINIYLADNKLMYGNIDSGISLNNGDLYTITLVKKNKYTMKTDGTKETNTVLEMYVNGEFNKNITNANKVDVTGANINIDIYNYIVYSKALSVNQENNNYKITLERYGQ